MEAIDDTAERLTTADGVGQGSVIPFARGSPQRLGGQGVSQSWPSPEPIGVPWRRVGSAIGVEQRWLAIDDRGGQTPVIYGLLSLACP